MISGGRCRSAITLTWTAKKGHSFNYLTPAAFANPAPETFGTLGVGNLTGPEFRAEAYNITNSPRRGNPGTGFGNLTTFGIIRTSAGNQRIMQFSMKYVF